MVGVHARFALLLATFLPAMSWAASPAPDTSRARSLAATCASCHTASNAGGSIPRLEGMPQDAMTRAMREYRDGTRAGTVMPQLAKGYTDAQITAIAAWYAERKGNAQP